MKTIIINMTAERRQKRIEANKKKRYEMLAIAMWVAGVFSAMFSGLTQMSDGQVMSIMVMFFMGFLFFITKAEAIRR